MLRNAIAIAVVCLMASTVQATTNSNHLHNNNNVDVNNNNYNRNNVDVNNRNYNSSRSNSSSNSRSRSNANSDSNSNSYSRGGNARASGGDSDQLQGQYQEQDASSQNTIVYEAQRIPVSSAYSAGLTSSNDTCMGSSSVGGQGMTFGLSLGSTWKDKDCIRRKDARLLFNIGFKRAAVALLCQSSSIREAVSSTTTLCSVAFAPANVSNAVSKPSCEYPTIGCKRKKKFDI